MKQAVVNGRWNMWLPDNIADWDAITGDYSARQGWEFSRFESFRQRLHYGDVFFDVGAEHGWISAVLAREFVGARSMVLFEPSPEFWVNIRRIWTYNGLDEPLGCYNGFVDVIESGDQPQHINWPATADAAAPEVPGMAYRSLSNGAGATPTTSVDAFVSRWGITPKALNIDVEGAELRVLAGAAAMLTHPSSDLESVWVSVHPDLMQNFGQTPDDLFMFMDNCGWAAQHLGSDHEEHYLFVRDDF